MDRRQFLKTGIIGASALPVLMQSCGKPRSEYTAGSAQRFDFLEVSGSYKNIGFQIGKTFGRNIREIIRRRKEWHSGLMAALESKKGKLFSDKLLELSRKHFPHIVDEITAMADGAGLSFNALWCMSIKSELGALDKDDLGCSSIFYKDENSMRLFHNEDGSTDYDGLMFVVQVTPPSGVSFVSLVYPGIITGNGPSLNDSGVVQTTNYIGSTKSEIGIPRYIIGRAILEAKTVEEAVQIVSVTPRAYPYHHHIGSMSDKKYYSVETIPGISQSEQPQDLYFHTNHLIFEKTCKYEHEDEKYKQSSSLSRFEVIQEKINSMPHAGIEAEHFLEILSSHQNAPYSPCRHPQDDIKGLTLGTALFDFEKGIFRLYKGNPCTAVKDGLYQEFKLHA